MYKNLLKIIITPVLLSLFISDIYSQTIQKPKAMSTKTVTIVKVKAPWYAFNFILPGQFKKTIPLYSKVNGLRFKAYTINKDANGKNFGGIYLWDSITNAQKWYSPKWYAEVKRKRGADPIVKYFSLIEENAHLPANKSYSDLEAHSVALSFSLPQNEDYEKYIAPNEGIFRIYKVQDERGQKELILFFLSSKYADIYIDRYKVKDHELYLTPVLLKNMGE